MPRLHPRVLDVGGAFSVFSGPYVEGIQEVPEGVLEGMKENLRKL